MFGHCHHLVIPKSPKTSAATAMFFKTISTISSRQDLRFTNVILTRLKAIFGNYFVRRLTGSSSWLCHCFFRPVDYFAAGQKSGSRTQNWLRFYSQFGTKERLFKFFHAQFCLAGSALAVSAAIHRDDLITDDLMANHSKDLNYIKSLKESTLTCDKCQKRHKIDQKVEHVEYCECSEQKNSVYGAKTEEVAWTPFLERKDIIVWRQEHPELPGLYAYKMYGRFDDITANEFLEVQLDLSEFRLSWDPSTAQCHIIDSTNPNETDKNDLRNISHVYYWEVNWPRMFSNRDYVCGRRSKVFRNSDTGQEDVFVLYTKNTEHPNCPKKSKAFRVENYWSVLTMKPFTSPDQPGIEFSLTAFENPGLSLPSYITTWVAIRGFPDFITNLRQACHERRKWLKDDNQRDQRNMPNPSKEPTYMETPKNYSQQQSNEQYA